VVNGEVIMIAVFSMNFEGIVFILIGKMLNYYYYLFINFW